MTVTYKELKREDYTTTIDGKAVDLFTLRNNRGAFVKITNYGSRIVQVVVPDRDGNPGDVVLGYDTIDAAVAGQKSMGSFIGRFANRVANARYTIDGVEYHLTANAGRHALHGGAKGTRFHVFDACQTDANRLELTYVFADGEEGHPGTLPLRVVYTFDDDNALTIAYDAVAADKTTVANFTDHTFFNLSGVGGRSVNDHVVMIPADRFLDLDNEGIPTGVLNPVEATAFDFRTPTAIGARIGADDDRLRRAANGYDHFFILGTAASADHLAARVVDPSSGRVLEVWTTEPGVQLYTGNGLSGEVPRDQGKGGAVYGFRSGLCLEPSHYPDAPNHPDFPGITLKPGQWYSGRIVYRFATER